ncbi:TetR/AcrR family transcriptional regulator C-terminal domain-containing protein [Kitasatospora sp. NPDC088346]|uniref:TetR/AcrR family transcriptional regulator n=1 Tax=Kitasatospora sp. NPDC088346 TaxID=3364073 RepID=UPI0037F3D101
MDQRGGSRRERIVAELRQRIDTGALAPGDRVPSTREITRHWGVAMATATRVLDELRRQGLVHAVPGVGTVVTTPPPGRAEPARRRPAPDHALTPERIVAAAVAVADTEGMAAVSMRRVAGKLGVATMSLYRHVADKDELLTRMMDTVCSTWSFPEQPPRGWRTRLELAAGLLWDTFRRHPWLAPAMSLTRPQPLPGAVPLTEWVLASFDGLGLDLHTCFTTHLVLLNYVRGTAVNLESEAEAEALTGLDNEQWLDTQEPALRALLATGRFPGLARITTTGYDFDLDRLFEFGLQRILDGIAVLVEAQRP